MKVNHEIIRLYHVIIRYFLIRSEWSCCFQSLSINLGLFDAHVSRTSFLKGLDLKGLDPTMKKSSSVEAFVVDDTDDKKPVDAQESLEW